MENSMGNPWKIHGKSMEKKNGKKEMFPWFSMPHKNAHKFLGSKPPKIGSKTGIRFDTKWHHNWLNQLLIWRISIIFRRASFLFSKKSDVGFLGQKKKNRWRIQFTGKSVFRKMSKSWVFDAMWDQIGWKFACVTVCLVRSSWKPPNLPNFNLNCQKNDFCEFSVFQFFGSPGVGKWVPGGW